MSVHVEPVRVYITIFLALMGFTVLTVWAAFQDFGALSDPIAIAIAIAKATLVVLFFMHVRHGTGLTKLVVAGGFLWLLILFGITMSDYLTRDILEAPAPMTVPADAPAPAHQ